MRKLALISLFLLNIQLIASSTQTCPAPRDLLAEALAQEEAYRRFAIRGELDELMYAINELGNSEGSSSQEFIISAENKAKNSVATLQDQLHTIMLAVATQPDASWSLKTNKLALILKGAEDALENDLPFPNFDFDTITKLGGNGEYDRLGSADSLYWQMGAVLTYLTLKGHAGLGSKIASVNGYIKAIEDSAILHATPLPRAFAYAPLNETVVDFPFFYRGKNSPPAGELAFLHNGYAFGGQRADMIKDKQFGPEDCSSWIGKLLGLNSVVTTADFLFYHNQQSGKGYFDPGQNGSAQQVELGFTLDAVEVKSLEDVRPGDIILYRNFSHEDPTHTKTAGRGGHIGIVTETNTENDELTILSYNRDIEGQNMEGFGTQVKPFVRASNIGTYFFRLIQHEC